MSTHTVWGHAGHSLYTLHPRERAVEELLPDDEDAITAPFVLGLWNEGGETASSFKAVDANCWTTSPRPSTTSSARLIRGSSSTRPSNDSMRYAKNAPRPSKRVTTVTSRASTRKRSACSTTSPRPPRRSTTSCKPRARPASPPPKGWPGPFFSGCRALPSPLTCRRPCPPHPFTPYPHPGSPGLRQPSASASPAAAVRCPRTVYHPSASAATRPRRAPHTPSPQSRILRSQ